MSTRDRVRRIAVLPGDGVGAEVVAGPAELLQVVADAGRIEMTGPWPVGASAFGELGTGLPADTLAACDDCDAMFFGAAGEHPGCRWTTTAQSTRSSACASATTCE